MISLKKAFPKLKLLISILSILFLFTISSQTFVKFDKETSISYAEEEPPASSQDDQHSEEDSLKDIELLAFLQHSFYGLTITEKQSYGCSVKIYFSPNTVYDNPPPEC